MKELFFSARKLAKIQCCLFVLGAVIGFLAINYLGVAPESAFESAVPDAQPEKVVGTVLKSLGGSEILAELMQDPGAEYLLHNSIIPMIFLAWFFLAGWRPFYMNLFSVRAPATGFNAWLEWGMRTLSGEKESSMEVINPHMPLVLIALLPLAILIFSVGFAFPAMALLLKEALEVKTMTGAVLTSFISLSAHGIFELSAMTFAGAMPMSIFYLIKNQREEDNDNGVMLDKTERNFKIVKEYVWSKPAIISVVAIFLLVFVASQIEGKLSMKLAEKFVIYWNSL